ncbi:GmrSD restriction endonuclease domain-containing protein [Arthrobacter monumenti]
MMLGKALSVIVGAILLVSGFTVPAEAATTYKASLRSAVRSLPVATERNTGYDRYRYFGDWKDFNRDCQDTRAEVLIQESKTTPRFTSSTRCTVSKGKWVTNWDNRTHYYASKVQIDHLIPVHEAWGSGAKSWSQNRRINFYNDMGDRRALNPQTNSLNSSKQASGPEAWMPPKNRCRYVADWVAIKIRWGLKVDRAEKDALVKFANSCSSRTITVTKR